MMKLKKLHTVNILILTINAEELYHNFITALSLLYGGLESVEYILMFIHGFLNYSRNSNFGYTLIVDVDYVEYLQPLHND